MEEGVMVVGENVELGMVRDGEMEGEMGENGVEGRVSAVNALYTERQALISAQNARCLCVYTLVSGASILREITSCEPLWRGSGQTLYHLYPNVSFFYFTCILSHKTVQKLTLQGNIQLSHTTRLCTYTSSLTLQGYVRTQALTLQGYVRTYTNVYA